MGACACVVILTNCNCCQHKYELDCLLATSRAEPRRAAPEREREGTLVDAPAWLGAHTHPSASVLRFNRDETPVGQLVQCTTSCSRRCSVSVDEVSVAVVVDTVVEESVFVCVSVAVVDKMVAVEVAGSGCICFIRFFFVFFGSCGG